MLSGGLDSTALTALLSMRIGRLESFSVDYRDNERDFVPNAFRPEMDAPYVRLAVRTFGTRHHSVVLEQEALLGALKQAVRYRGFPGMADIDSSLLLFAREIVRWAAERGLRGVRRRGIRRLSVVSRRARAARGQLSVVRLDRAARIGGCASRRAKSSA